MGTLIVIAVLVALALAGYSFYLHHKLTSLSQIYDDLKDLLDGPQDPPVT